MVGYMVETLMEEIVRLVFSIGLFFSFIVPIIIMSYGRKPESFSKRRTAIAIQLTSALTPAVALVVYLYLVLMDGIPLTSILNGTTLFSSLAYGWLVSLIIQFAAWFGVTRKIPA